MHYFRPGDDRFVGDCMPFFHDGVFHLYYLLDEGHHQGRGGLGGHQWAHASTRDLAHWTHHPLALAVEEDWEGSICTGSVFWHDGSFHAFYAVRKPDWSQHLAHAVSDDGIAFRKLGALTPPPPGYHPNHLRDPFVFRDEQGGFQMLVSAYRSDHALPDRGGCLLRLSSPDLFDWSVEEPLLFPGARGEGGVPECADHFVWRGWHYLVFGLGLESHYRIADDWRGPWLRPPGGPLLDSRRLAVMKTAPFGPDRRLGAAWIGTRAGDRDDGPFQWGGDLILRELVQNPDDGALSTRFVPELIPSGGAHHARLTSLTPGVSGDAYSLSLDAPNGQAVAALSPVPHDFVLRCRVTPRGERARFGLGLRGSGALESQYELVFDPASGTIALADQSMTAPLDAPFDLTIVCRGDLIDVCVGERRCLIHRLPERRGDRLFWFCEAGSVAFDAISMTADLTGRP